MTQTDSPSRLTFGLRFSMLARRWRRHVDAQLAKLGLTDATWVPLIHVSVIGGGITQKDLAYRVGIDSSTLVRVIDIHVRDGLIERRRDPNDGRARLIHLTPAGEQRVAELQGLLAEAEAAMLADLPDTTIEALMQGFDAIDARIDQLEDHARHGETA